MLTVIALIPPATVLLAGMQQLSLATSGGYMSELAALVAPVLIALGVMLMAPGVLFLIVRRKFAFVFAIVVAAGIVAVAVS